MAEPKCGHFRLAPYGCENCFMSHEEIAAERAALEREKGGECDAAAEQNASSSADRPRCVRQV